MTTAAPERPANARRLGASREPEAGQARAAALDAMLFAVRRMRLPATDRQVATLLAVAESHLLPPESKEEEFPHGTLRGYRRHRRRKESACAACREACRREAAARRKRARAEKPCGTEAAYHRHLRRWEKPCADCKAAHRLYMRNYRSRRATAAS